MFLCKFTVVKNFLCVIHSLLAAELQCDETFICEMYKIFIIDRNNHNNEKLPKYKRACIGITLYCEFYFRDQSHRNLDTPALELHPFVKVVEFVDTNQACIGDLLGLMIKSPIIDFHACKLFIY